MDEKKIQSIADDVFEQIENAILGGDLPRGSLVTEQKLCERFGVSRTPVREAMMRLRQEGLVEESGKGAVVIGITHEDIADIYDVRLRVECLAAARAADRMTEAELDRLRETLELQEFYTEKGVADSIRNLDSEFHRRIFVGSGSRIIGNLLTDLHRKVQLYRRVSVEDPGRAQKATLEHRAIYDAIAVHDIQRAEELMIQHIRNAREHILKSIKP